MILALLFANLEWNILLERDTVLDFVDYGMSQCLDTPLIKVCYTVYTVLGDVSIYALGKIEYDELACDLCYNLSCKGCMGKPPTERLFLDKYRDICLSLDEIVWKGYLENTDKDRIRRFIRLRPSIEF